MRASKTHFEQIPLETVKKITTEDAKFEESLAEVQRVLDEERRERFPNGVPEFPPS